MNEIDQLLTTAQAAELLGGLSPKTLNKWRFTGDGPKYKKIGGAVRYSVADLQAFVEAGTRQSTSEDSVAVASRG